jgi:hypothetical protein
MVNGEIALHLHNYQTTGGELIMGTGRFVAPKTLEVRLKREFSLDETASARGNSGL